MRGFYVIYIYVSTLSSYIAEAETEVGPQTGVQCSPSLQFTMNVVVFIWGRPILSE